MKRTKSRTVLGQIVVAPTGLWSQIRVCPCCGKFVVRLRVPDQPGRRLTCFFNGWDGSPWFTDATRVGPRAQKGSRLLGSNAIRHQPYGRNEWKMKLRGERNLEKKPVEKETEDSFFSLDVEE